MDLTFISELYIPTVMALCLCVGYILKHWIKDMDNKYIPTILAALGAMGACAAKSGVSLDIVVSGMLTGLASTGLHQAFKQMIGE
nr:MAG TPA: holin [Caudoviricetes sp.]